MCEELETLYKNIIKFYTVTANKKLINQPTQWSRVLLQKLNFSRLMAESPNFIEPERPFPFIIQAKTRCTVHT